MKFSNLVRAGLLAASPFLLTTCRSAQAIGEGVCQQLVFTTPCLDAPLNDYLKLAGTVAAVYEAAARLVPTERNYSLVHLLGLVLDKIAPNVAPTVDSLEYAHKTGLGRDFNGLA